MFRVEIRNEDGIIHILGCIRVLIRDLPFTPAEEQCILVSAVELTRNVLIHGGSRGVFTAEPVPDGIRITVSDNGPGIRDVDMILRGTYRSPSGLGLGLAGAKRLMDEFHLETSAKGTTIIATKRTSGSIRSEKQ